MTIGELSRRAATSRDTIRYYERLGLLEARGRRRSYKEYGPDALARLQRIRYAKGLGFRLAEIAQMLPQWVAGTVDDSVRKLALQSKLDEVEQEQERLLQLARALRAQIGQL